ncbi:MAG: alpha-hydroxy acid oxidase [Chloroflexota bacterium]
MDKPLNLHEFEPLAREKLPKMVYGYYVSGSDDEVAVNQNREAYNRIKMRPRMMRGVATRDTSVEVLGKRIPFPVIIAPMGFMGLAHEDGELGMARAASAKGIPMILSTASNHTIEQVAEAKPDTKWFQLYVYKDRHVTEKLVQRAEAAGYEALVLTVDVPVLGKREADIRNGFHLPEGYTRANLIGDEMSEMLPVKDESGLNAYLRDTWDSGLEWGIIDWLKTITDMPILVKGVLRGDDAQIAVEYGASGVIVSNHGGRQLDSAPAPIDVLQEVVDAVDGRADVLMDGGVRRGTDIAKALCMGAKAVLIGRPMMWSLAYDGQAGVEYALELIAEEFDNGLAQCGCKSTDDLTPDLLMR